jgi:hypothetical protein
MCVLCVLCVRFLRLLKTDTRFFKNTFQNLNLAKKGDTQDTHEENQ